ncbi:transcription factor IIA, alpha/beta subunit-domain-containing protein [Globomyces pollinis-pini]|nr:transcription factor IIA, alpha/beta subunit-domain-containing protein [Globomyces pollinis-pini]
MSRRFAELGLDENVLTDLRQIWETKIRQMGVAPFPVAQNAIPVQYLAMNPGLMPMNMNPEIGYRPLTDQQLAQHNVYLPQNDGASDIQVPEANMTREEMDQIILKASIPKAIIKKTKKQSRIVQVDGPQDEEEDDDEEQDDGGDSVLGSDLDDDDTDDEQQIEDMILCQFEKVSHVRNKWKCILKDGIGNISGRDMVFHRATGDFDFMR